MHDYSATYRGTVKAMHEDYDDTKLVRLEIAPTNMPKPKRKKGEPQAASNYVPTRSETISKDMAAHLTIGDTVECVTTIKKVRRMKRKGNAE